MSYLNLSGIQKRFAGGVVAVRDFDLVMEKGEFVSFLGPSGCGKTTTLRMIAGFEQPTTGRIVLDGTDITDRPPNRRNIGMVFQAYALFPNMTVADNIGFGLNVRKRDTASIARRTTELLELIGLPGTGKRYPWQMSGGQQQRVALARAPHSSRRCSSSTNRSPPSTRRSGSACERRSVRSSGRWGSRRSMSPTTRRRRSRSPIGSS
jgi:putative spermidine/putrescine transport system ATP-binding protein